MISTLISIIALSLLVNLSPQPIEEPTAFPALQLNEAQLAQLGISVGTDEIHYGAKVPYIGTVELSLNHKGQLSSTTWRKSHTVEKAADWPETDFHLQSITNADGRVMFARNDREPAYLFNAYVPIKIAFPAEDSLTFWFSPREALWDILAPDQANLYREYAAKLLEGQGADPFVHTPFQAVDALRLDDAALNRLGFTFGDTTLHYEAAVPNGNKLVFDFGERMQCISHEVNPQGTETPRQPYPQFVSDTSGFQSFRWNTGEESPQKESPAYLSKVRHRLVAVWVESSHLNEPYLFWFEANEVFLKTIYGSEDAPSGERYVTWLKTQHPGLLPTENPIQLSPNPAQTNVRLSLADGENQSYRWQLLNLQGQVLRTSDWVAPQTATNIKLEAYSSGVYLVVVRLQNGTQFSHQLLVEN
ncbi:MAG: T9SS type A sorting domain-containing protein [Bacteroidota bacterium]